MAPENFFYETAVTLSWSFGAPSQLPSYKLVSCRTIDFETSQQQTPRSYGVHIPLTSWTHIRSKHKHQWRNGSGDPNSPVTNRSSSVMYHTHACVCHIYVSTALGLTLLCRESVCHDQQGICQEPAGHRLHPSNFFTYTRPLMSTRSRPQGYNMGEAAVTGL